MGLATLVGFDSAANLAEEAEDPFRTLPRAIVGSVVAAGVLGLLFLITITIAIDDIPASAPTAHRSRRSCVTASVRRRRRSCWWQSPSRCSFW
ncbi:amino acid permease [Streptomyces sp. NPDC020817]|uniref:amino acid permease n=1 Tax=Streptomyces sp. NPDC020817 TaxID=3365095 RepID=UPI003790A40E